MWKPDPPRGFSISSTYVILLALSGVKKGRFERVLWGLVRIWKSWAPFKVVCLLLADDLEQTID